MKSFQNYLHRSIRPSTLSERETDRGSAQILESVIVLPAVMIAVLSLVILSVYAYQCFALKCVTDRMASVCAESVRIPGYPVLYVDKSAAAFADFSRGTAYKPSADDISDMAERHDPYRYIFGTDNTQTVRDLTVSSAKSVLLISDINGCYVDIDSEIGGQTVTVTVSASCRMHFFPDGWLDYTAVSSAPVADHCETVRMSDYVSDIAGTLTGTTSLKSILKEKIGGIGRNLEETKDKKE